MGWLHCHFMTGNLQPDDRLGDFTADRRVLTLTGMAAMIGVISAFVALALLQRSEEHTSELQSRLHLVCPLLLEKKHFYLLARSLLFHMRIASPSTHPSPWRSFHAMAHACIFFGALGTLSVAPHSKLIIVIQSNK